MDFTQPVTTEGQDLLDIIARHRAAVAGSAAEHDRTGHFPVGVLKGLAAEGVLAATVPRSHGGLGVASVHDVCLAVAALAQADASLALSLHMQFSRGVTMSYELRHSPPPARELAERLLRLMATGQAVIGGALKDAGQTTVLLPDGDAAWTLRGRKILVSMAPIATHFVVAAQAQPATGPARVASAFLPAHTPGLRVPDNWDGLGMRASASSEVVFDNCPVPAADLFLRGPVGERNDAALIGQTISSIGLLGVYAGIAATARDTTLAGLRRRGGDTPAAARTLVAELEVKLFSLRSALATALATADHLVGRADLDAAQRGRRMMTAFQCAKLVVNRSAAAIVEDCMTLAGGSSFGATHPLSRHYRDVRAGWFMQPYTFADAVDRLSSWALATG